jgi:hypothetical protein
LFGFPAVNNQHFADVLDRVRVGALADAGQGHFALVAVERGGADFDEFMGGQGAVDFGDDGVGKAFFTQLQDRIEVVRACPQLLAFLHAQFKHGFSIRAA